ncbi:MAG: DUF2283 domain-containing protein [Actinomycetota bacterium]|nr:DUF2283 domain-containing protein [Actinomycetota bacterium]
MSIAYDALTHALYIQVQEGEIADTIEIGDHVYADVDEHQETIGIEFLDPDNFLTFIKEHNGVLSLPAPVATLAQTKTEAD